MVYALAFEHYLFLALGILAAVLALMALSDAVRLRFAMEGAARRNIRQGLEAIAALDL